MATFYRPSGAVAQACFDSSGSDWKNVRMKNGACALMLLFAGCADDAPAGVLGETTESGTPTTASVDTSEASGLSTETETSTGGSSGSSTSAGTSRCWGDLAVGEFEVLYDGFGDGSEGIAFGADGRLIATTNRNGVGTLWELTPGGRAIEFAQLPYALGLAPRPGGGFVVASIGELEEPDGAVYDVSADGDVSLLTSGMDSPNFVALVADGSALVSDVFGTRVFHVSASGTVSTAIENVPSPNGIAYSPSRDALYVASTLSTNGELIRYDVGEDDLPIEVSGVEILHTGPGALNDGIAVDVDGFVYVLANLRGEIWRVDGAATTLQAGDVVASGLESPASIAFGRADGFDPCSGYVTELLGTRVVRVSLGSEGLPLPLYGQ